MRKNKIYLILLLPLVALTFAACSDDDDSIPTVKPTASGTMTDADGNEYGWVRIGNLDWTTRNSMAGEAWIYQTYLSGNYEEEFYYDSEEEELELLKTNGNYYTYEQALESVPDGWRLPTDDDWKQLEMALGMSKKDADKTGWRDGAEALMVQTADEGTGLAFTFAGQLAAYYTMSFSKYHVGDYGYYWSSTIDSTYSSPTAYIRKIMPGLNKVYRAAASTTAHYYSVRYVRDAE